MANLFQSFITPRGRLLDSEELVDHLALLFSYVFVLAVIPYWLTIGGPISWRRSARARFALLTDGARWPEPAFNAASTTAALGASGVYAVWAAQAVELAPKEQRVVSTGVRVWAPPGSIPLALLRGRPFDTLLEQTFAPTPCTVDGCSMLAVHDASGEIKIAVRNTGKQKVDLGPADKRPLGYVYFSPSVAPPKYTRCSTGGRKLWWHFGRRK